MGRHSKPTVSRTKGQHRKPSQVAEVTQAAATGLGATAMLGGVVTGVVAAAGSAEAATANDFYRLRVCESSDNYRANTGNGFYGAYQFELATWRSNGFSGYPHEASPATQDQAAQLLFSRRGWQPWPACSARLGLVDTRASREATRASLGGAKATTGTPTFAGTVLSTAMSQNRRADVFAWQSQMRKRGWPITVDGYFGPQSARIARDFAIEKRLGVTLLGQVDSKVWRAAWVAPVT